MEDEEATNSHLHYRRGEWLEKLEHEAETRHYAEGGTARNWPGYKTLIKRELAISRGHKPQRQKSAPVSKSFVAQRMNHYNLMISPLVTISEFLRLIEGSRWTIDRESRINPHHQNPEAGLSEINGRDPDNFPISVTWLDAVAYCKAFEEKTGLPVRLMNIEEWQYAFSEVISSARKQKDESLDLDYTDLRSIFLKEPQKYPRATCSAPDGRLQYSENPPWRTTTSGIEYLYAKDFGEWLLDYQSGFAPAACAATGESVYVGPLERALMPANLTMAYKGIKIGFRICYVATPDA